MTTRRRRRIKPEIRELPETYRVPWPYQPLLRRWTCRPVPDATPDGTERGSDESVTTLQNPRWTRRHDNWRAKAWLSFTALIGSLFVLSGLQSGAPLLSVPGLGLLLFVAVMWFRRTRGADVHLWFPTTAPRTGETLVVGLDASAAGAPLDWVTVHLRCVALSPKGDVFVLGESRPVVDDTAHQADPGAGLRLEVPIPGSLPASGPWGRMTILWGLVVIWKSGDRPTSRSYSVRVAGPPGPGPSSPHANRLPTWESAGERPPRRGSLIFPTTPVSTWSGRGVLNSIGLVLLVGIGLLCSGLGIFGGAPGLLLFAVAGALAWFVPGLQPPAPSRGFLLLTERDDGRPGELRARATRGARLLVGVEAEIEARGPEAERQLVDAATAVLTEPGTDFTHPALVSRDVAELADSVPRSHLVAIVRWQYLGQGRRPVTEFVLTNRSD